MDTVRQTEEARVRQNSSERDAERDREAERPRREQSDRRKHRGRGTVICGEGSRDTHRRRETEKLRDRHTVRDTERNRDPETQSDKEIRRPADRQNLTEPGTHAEIKKPTDRERRKLKPRAPRDGKKKNAATRGRETASPQHLPENALIFFFFLHLCFFLYFF